ncbi:unnamed protein product [Prunus brigantina]
MLTNMGLKRSAGSDLPTSTQSPEKKTKKIRGIGTPRGRNHKIMKPTRRVARRLVVTKGGVLYEAILRDVTMEQAKEWNQTENKAIKDGMGHESQGGGSWPATAARSQ